jgi:uncharacterized protein
MPNLESARAWYGDSDPVHNFDHILRVYRMAGKIALAEGADPEIVQAAALLHDAEGSNPADKAQRKLHHHASAEFAAEILRAEGWDAQRVAAVQHCIRAHRFRDASEPPQTLEAKVLFDADKLDAIGAIGLARVIAYNALAGQPLYSPPSQQFIETGSLCEKNQEPHSAYHEYLFKLSKLKDRMFTQTGRAIAQERHSVLEGFFQRLIAEWNGEK